MMAAIPQAIKVGSSVWVWDRYGRNCHTFEDVQRRWTKYEVIGETRVSWLIGSRWPNGSSELCKVNKKTGEPNGVHRIRWTLDGLRAEWDAAQWVSKHAYPISDAVRRCNEATLRKVAELIGYKVEV